MSRLNLLIVLFFYINFSFARSEKQQLIFHTVIDDSLKKTTRKNLPVRAAMLSTILPGAGQVYNKRIWKVPIIYIAFAGFAYVYQNNYNSYNNYKDALTLRYDDDPTTNDKYKNFSDDNLIVLKNQYKRRSDLGLFGIVATYLLNIVDAAVDANLREFDVKINEDISMNIFPYSHVATTNVPSNFGLQLKLNFK